MSEYRQKYSLRKLSVGLASVVIGGTLFITTAQTVNADPITSTQAASAYDDSDNTHAKGSESTKENTKITPTGQSDAPAGSTSNTGEGVPGQAISNDKSSSIKVDKPTPVKTGTEKDTNPISYEKQSDDTDKQNAEWLEFKNNDTSIGRVAAYLKMKGKDGKDYYTKYFNKNNDPILINTKEIDTNSLEYILVYENNGDQKINPQIWFNKGDASNSLVVDTSRLNEKTGMQVEDSMGTALKPKFQNPSKGGDYKLYQELVQKGEDISKVTAFYFNEDNFAPGEIMKASIPLKYTGTAASSNPDSFYFGVRLYRATNGLVGQTIKFTGMDSTSQPENPGSGSGNTGAGTDPTNPTKPVDPTENSNIKTDKPSEGMTAAASDTNPFLYDNQKDGYKIKNDEWLKMGTGEVAAYLKMKGKDGKDYYTKYVNGNSNPVLINTKEIDPNSIEYVVIYKNTTDKKQNPLLWFAKGDNYNLLVDKSRLNATTGMQVEDSMGTALKPKFQNPSKGGDYKLYQELVQKGEDISKVTAFYFNEDNFAPGEIMKASIPLKYVGKPGDSLNLDRLELAVNSYASGGKYVTEKVNFASLDKTDIQVDKPSVGMTDDKSATDPILYRDRDELSNAKNAEWFDIGQGEVAAYLKVTGKDGNVYYTKYNNSGINDNPLLLDVTRFDPNSFEYVLVYKNTTDSSQRPNIWFSKGDSKLVIDTSKIDAKTGLKVEDSMGLAHELKLENPSKGGDYKLYQELVQMDKDVTKVNNFYFMGDTFRSGETIKVSIPLKYTGEITDKFDSDAATFQVHSYGSGKDAKTSVSFAKPLFRISESKIDRIIPTVYGKQLEDKNQIWIYLEDVDRIMQEANLNWRDLFVNNNFYNYNGPFDTKMHDPKDNFDIVYSTGYYFIKLREIQDVISKHGYSVQFAYNPHDKQYEAMPFYGYSKSNIASAYLVDKNGDPMGNVGSSYKKDAFGLYISIIPTILVNPDLHYTQGDKVKDRDGQETNIWDPRAEGLPNQDSPKYNADALLKAYNDAGYDSFKQRKPGDFYGVREEDTLTALNPYGGDPDVGILTKNPGLTVTIVYQKDKDSAGERVNEVDLNKAGIYTVVYSRVFFGPEERPDNSLINLIAIDGGKQGEMILNQGKVYVNPVEKESKKITRTINYVDEQGNPLSDQDTQTVTFTRDKITDIITGEVSYTDWQSDDPNFTEVVSPKIPGYSTKTPVVDSETITASDSDKTINVVYLKNKVETETKDVTRIINYVDEEGHPLAKQDKQTVTFTREKTTELATGNVTYSDWESKNDTFTKVISPEIQGYSTKTPVVDSETVTASDSDKTINVVYLKFKVETESRDITRTINYVDEEDNTLYPSEKQTVTFTRQVITDPVTGKVTYTDWQTTNNTFAKVVSPEIPGYITQTKEVDSDTVDADSQDSFVNVVYTKNPAPKPEEIPNSQTNELDNNKSKDSHKTVKEHKGDYTSYPVKGTDLKHPASKDGKSANVMVKAAKIHNAAAANSKSSTSSSEKGKLPQTGEKKSSLATLGLTVIGASLIALAGAFTKKKED